MRNKAIGIFDSGMGGLTVLRQLNRYLRSEDTIYLGDTARVPYGIRSPETILKYSKENTEFLLKKNIKILVVACNTSSAVALEELKKKYKIEFVGVVEPSAKKAVRLTKNGIVGVIGTSATIRSGAYRHAVYQVDPRVEVFDRACPLFVPLVEEGWVNNKIALQVAEKYLEVIKKKGVDVLLLGCTHYPLLKKVIQKVMGTNVTLVDSATESAKSVLAILKENGLLRKRKVNPKRKYFVTDAPDRFREIGSRFLGKKIIYAEKVFLI